MIPSAPLSLSFSSNTIFSRAGFVPLLALLGLLVVMIPVSQWFGRRKDAGTARVI